MKMDLKEDDAVSEIGDTAEEYWGGGLILRSGYSLLRPDGRVGDYIGDGDVVDALPDPDFCRDWADPRRRSRAGAAAHGKVHERPPPSPREVRHMRSRLGSRAFAIIDPRAVEAAALRGEDMASEGKDSVTYLLGECCEDGNGVFLSIEGASLFPEGAVGMCVSYEEGGVSPSEETKARFLSMFPEGLLMVADVYARQVAMYRKEGGGLAPATALMRERSDPDRMAAAHVLLGYAAALHYLADEAFEEQVSRVLESRSQRGDLLRLVVVLEVELQDYVRGLGQLAVRDCGEGDHLRPYAARDDGRLDDGRGLSRVGQEDDEVLFRDYGRGHLSDEVDVESELDQTHREELAYEP